MRTVVIITHCFAAKHVDYAKALTVQLSSLVRWPTRECNARVVVFTTKEDEVTLETCAAFSDRVDIDLYLRPPSHIYRRGIGRNEAAKVSKADVVWFCDADYFFGDGCLDALSRAEFTGLAYPKLVMITKSHQIGDQHLAEIIPGEVYIPDLSVYVEKREKFSTGGILIVDGDTARRGYRDGTSWCQPVDPAGGFLDPKEDIGYRKQFSSSTGLDLPNLFRARHSQCPFQDPAARLAQTAHVK